MRHFLFQLGIAVLIVLGANCSGYIIHKLLVVRVSLIIFYSALIILAIILVVKLIRIIISKISKRNNDTTNRFFAGLQEIPVPSEVYLYEVKEPVFHSPRSNFKIKFLIIFSILVFLFIIIVFQDYLKYILIKYNLTVSALVVLFVFQFLIRKRHLQKQTWKKISDNWLKWSGLPALTVGGFSCVALNQATVGNILKISLDPKYVNQHQITLFYIMNLLLIFFAFLLCLLGKSMAQTEESNIPPILFGITFAFAWLGIAGFYSLVLDGIILTLHAHLAG